MVKRMRSRALLFIALCIRPPSISAETIHRLKQGETLYSLARDYGVSLDALIRRNGITNPSSLSVGTQLYIPGSSPAAPESGASNPNPAEAPFHVVKKGDTYYSIARRYSIDVALLLELNGRSDGQTLGVGERLTVKRLTVSPSATPASVQSSGPADPPPGDTDPPPSRPSSRASRVQEVPWWPVAGLKRPLEGKLAGVSIEADSMSYVHAVAAGNVVWTGPYRGFGNVVLVDSRGYIYLYGGNEDLFVNIGQSVNAGSRIGRLGSSGANGTSQSMYFSVFREGLPVPPDKAPRG